MIRGVVFFASVTFVGLFRILAEGTIATEQNAAWLSIFAGMSTIVGILWRQLIVVQERERQRLLKELELARVERHDLEDSHGE